MCTVAIRFTTEGDQSLLPTPSISLQCSFYSLYQPEYIRTRTHINIYNIYIFVHLYTHIHTHTIKTISLPILCSPLSYISIPFTVAHTMWRRRITLYTRPIRDFHHSHQNVQYAARCCKRPFYSNTVFQQKTEHFSARTLYILTFLQ